MKFTKQSGMALLEILVAMLIFALAILPLVKLQVMSMDATKAGYYKTETAAAALSLMDYLSANKKDILDGNWKDVKVVSGHCGTSKEEKIVCDLLDGNGKGISPDGNAVICVFGKQPKYVAASSGKKVNRDMYLTSIRAIWYIGKRDKGAKNLNRALEGRDCGGDYDGSIKKDLLSKENIDHLEINMAY